jgi:hypothetical protein
LILNEQHPIIGTDKGLPVIAIDVSVNLGFARAVHGVVGKRRRGTVPDEKLL